MKNKNLFVFGILAAVFISAVLLVFNNTNDVKKSAVLSSSKADITWYDLDDLPSWYCDKVKLLWEEGAFTERFEDAYAWYDASSCKSIYFEDPYTWVDSSDYYYGSYTPWNCQQLVNVWEEGGWTERFGDWSYLKPSTCKYYYYTNVSVNYDGEYYEIYDWPEAPGDDFDDYWWNYIDYFYFDYANCMEIRNIWDEGDWTANYGSIYAPKACDYWHYDQWNDPDDYWWNYIGEYDFTLAECMEIKLLWEEGDWTANYGTSYAPESCDYWHSYEWKSSYMYTYWWNYIEDGDFTYDNCIEIRDLWYEGDWTENYGSIYAPSECAWDYNDDWQEPYEYGYWWSYMDEDEFNYSDCLFIKSAWDEGDWTENYSSTYAPGVCADVYESSWYDYTYWWSYIDYDNFTYEECSDIKSLWDEGDWSKHYGSSYAPQACDEYYSYNWIYGFTETYWWNYIDYYDFTYDQCLEIKEIWNEGDWTERYGSTYGWSSCVRYFDWNPFPDTDLTDLDGQAAKYLYYEEVINGYPDGEFKGWKFVNRAEAAKFLLLAKDGIIEYIANNGWFKDVEEGQWYTSYIVRAATRGIINGYDDGYFRPNNNINTVEFLKMFAETFDLSYYLDHDFVDVVEGSWYAKYAGVAAYYDLFPYRNSYLYPSSLLTREEVAIALYQYLTY